MVFRAHSSKGVDKTGAKCNMGFGRISEIYLLKLLSHLQQEGMTVQT